MAPRVAVSFQRWHAPPPFENPARPVFSRGEVGQTSARARCARGQLSPASSRAVCSVKLGSLEHRDRLSRKARTQTVTANSPNSIIRCFDFGPRSVFCESGAVSANSAPVSPCARGVGGEGSVCRRCPRIAHGDLAQSVLSLLFKTGRGGQDFPRERGDKRAPRPPRLRSPGRRI
jgi:hypothetical protein